LRSVARLAALGLAWALVAAIVWLSLMPSPPSIDIDQADKLGHAFAYASTMFCFAQLYLRAAVRVRYAAGLVALGIALEFIQDRVGRDFELADMLADAIGVALGWGAALILTLRIPTD
jgi:VanZ family protein